MSERIAGDAGASVGVNKGLVKVGFFVGSEGGDDLATRGDLATTEHEAEKTMKGDEVGAEGIVGVFGVDDFGEVEGVDANVGVEGEANIAATDGVAEFLVFVFGVDDEDFGADHHGAKSFEFDGEGFASAGFRKDNEVGVFQSEAVEDDEAIVVHVDAVEDALFLSEVGGSEGEAGRDGTGVHVAADLELVGALGHGAIHSLFLLGAGDLAENHLLAEEGFDFVLDEVELVERVGPDGDIKTEAEELLGADLELIAEFFGVVDGGFEFGVADFAFFGVDIVAGLELGDLFTEVFHDDGSFDRVNIHGDIEDLIDIDEGRDPASVELAGVAVNIHGAAIFGAEAEVAGVELEGAGRNEVAKGGDALFEGLLDFGVLGGLGLGGDVGGREIRGGGAFFECHYLVPFLT